MHTNYIQLPPDGSGKKLLAQRVILFTVNDITYFPKGTVFTTSVTNNTFKVAESVIVGGVKMIHAMFVATAQEAAVEPQNGEDLLINNVSRATVIAAPYYEFFNLNSLVSFDNPYHGQIIDNRGQANVRFAEGSPSMDAFGNLRVSNARMLGAYEYTNGDMADLFTDHVHNGGTIVHSPLSSQMILTTTTSSGSECERVTNRYHYYQPGVGNLVIITLSLGNISEANNVRGWGYGDKLNGLFWRLMGTTFQVVRRSTVSNPAYTRTATGTSGATTFTINDATSITTGMYIVGEGFEFASKITNVSGTTITIDHPLWANVSGGSITITTVTEETVNQSNWNGDKLNGTGFSRMTLDLTKANFFWIDFAWLGVGPVRMGVLAPDGTRAICHTFENPNAHPGAYMASGSLPIRYHNYNTGSLSAPATMNLVCSAVYSESDTDYTFWRFADIERAPTPVTTNTPVLSLKPKLIVNGIQNRVGMYPCTLSVVVTGSTDAMVAITIYDDASLTGATWAGTSEGNTIYDTAATTIANGTKFKTFYVGFGAHELDLYKYYETNDEGYHVLADGTGTYTMHIVGTKLNGTTANVGISFCYRELR